MDTTEARQVATDGEGFYLWVIGAGTKAKACISREPPSDPIRWRPLQAVLSHLDLDEWEWLE